MEELRSVLIDAAILIIPVLTAIALRYLNQYLTLLGDKVEGEIGRDKYYLLYQFVETVIRAAEQITGLEGDEAKKEYVFNRLRGYADDLGLSISDEQLDALIEGIYHAIKGSLKETRPLAVQ